MEKAVTAHSITTVPDSKKNQTSAKRRAYDDYFCVFSFSKKPISEGFINDMSSRLIDFANNGDKNGEAFRINDFFDAMGMSRGEFYRLVGIWPQLKSAHEYALSRIASNRERGAATRKYEASTIKSTIGFYCDISREEQKRLAALREETESSHENIQFVLIPAPKTGKVKPKKLKVAHENIQAPE